MKDHIMLDIETLSTSTWNAVITQIGACRFSSEGVAVNGASDQFLVGLDTAPQMRMGRVMDEDTMRWWDEQEGSPFLKDYFHPAHRS